MLGSAVKFGRIAEGVADIYPRLAPTCEWDVAAGCAVVTAAGGRVTDGRRRALRFGQRRGRFHRAGFHCLGRPAGRCRPLVAGCHAHSARSLLSSAGQRLPRLVEHALRIGGEGIAVCLAAEQIEPLAEITQNQGLPAMVTPRATSTGS